MKVETHNEAGRCRQKGCRSARIVARQLCRQHYNMHMRHGTLHHFPAERPWRIGDPHICQHEPSANCYKNHMCRCDRCRTADRTRQAKVKVRHMRGHAPALDATPIREHLAAQTARDGVTLRQCADDTGISYHLLRNVSCGATKKVSPIMARILLNWEGIGWCETCTVKTRAWGPGRWCVGCYEKKRRQHAA